jgi:hypothetical protein
LLKEELANEKIVKMYEGCPGKSPKPIDWITLKKVKIE